MQTARVATRSLQSGSCICPCDGRSRHEPCPCAELAAHRHLAGAVVHALDAIALGWGEVAMQTDPLIAIGRESFLDCAIAEQVVVTDHRGWCVYKAGIHLRALQDFIGRPDEAERP